MDFSAKEIILSIPEYFDPQKAGNRTLCVVYHIHDSGAGDGVWTVTVQGGACIVCEGEPEVYDTKVYLTEAIYKRIVQGRLDIQKLAYTSGAIRYYGNTLGHSELNSYCKLPWLKGIIAI